MMHFSEMHSSAHLAHLVETLVAHFKADISEDHTHAHTHTHTRGSNPGIRNTFTHKKQAGVAQRKSA